MRRKKPVSLVIISSRAIPGMLSLRPAESPDAASGKDLRLALAAAGYEPGDEVELRPKRAPLRKGAR
jgi:hypothetical protein